MYDQFTGEVNQRCSVKNAFLKISQNSQESTSARGFFYKDAGLRPVKKEPLVQVLSCEFFEIFKSTFFIEHIHWLFLNLRPGSNGNFRILKRNLIF